ncbi:helix-turn-helix transcriptional regulator [Streptomyces sp. NPDC047070]|uniref:helix-turn-helix domain-containing protein n=1 Tax=Streptomyces sp. NPDC047070 TaxID=3154923 RepID=UPI00345713F2
MSSTIWPPRGLGSAENVEQHVYGALSPYTYGDATVAAPWVQLFPDVVSGAALLREFTCWVEIPEAPDELVSPMPGMIREIRSWTGWSQRDLGEVLHTSHTTVRKLESDSRVTAKSRPAASLVPALHNLARRLYRAAEGDLDRLSVALATPGPNGLSATQHLVDGAFPRAYSVALEALQGGRQEMITSGSNDRLPDATVEMI